MDGGWLFDNARSGLFAQSTRFSNAGTMRSMSRWKRDARSVDAGCERRLRLRKDPGVVHDVHRAADSELDVGSSEQSARRQGERSAGNGEGRARTRRKRLWARAASCAEKAKEAGTDSISLYLPAQI